MRRKDGNSFSFSKWSRCHHAGDGRCKKCLADAGSDQWQNGYPNADIIIDDIISGQAYVALEEGELLAYAAVTKSPEVAYEDIYEGNWQAGESEYLVFHRIAVAADVQGQGVAQTF